LSFSAAVAESEHSSETARTGMIDFIKKITRACDGFLQKNSSRRGR
jgi:hypothetical protein